MSDVVATISSLEKDSVLASKLALLTNTKTIKSKIFLMSLSLVNF
jgi:hypothetical protein